MAMETNLLKKIRRSNFLFADFSQTALANLHLHQLLKIYNSFLNLATGILSCSLYLATVRRAIL
jgi:hypothetical protein